MKDTTEKTIRELMKFLTDEEGNEIWLLVDSGAVISGVLKTLPTPDPEMITLASAIIHKGDHELYVDDANIIIQNIQGSGRGKPYLTKM